MKLLPSPLGELSRVISGDQYSFGTGGTRLSTWDQSLSREPTFVTCRDTLAEMWTSTRWCEYRSDTVIHTLTRTSARSVEFYEGPGKLSKIPVDESKIPEELRIPRVTSAVW